MKNARIYEDGDINQNIDAVSVGCGIIPFIFRSSFSFLNNFISWNKGALKCSSVMRAVWRVMR